MTDKIASDGGSAAGANPQADWPQVDWEAKLQEHGPWLRAVVRARVSEPDGVDEVMQEISLAAVRQRAPLCDATKVAPWLYRLAVRQALLFRRSAGRRRKLTDRYGERVRRAEVDATVCDPLDWLVADERRQVVRDALDQLAPRDKEILLLKYTQGWSYREIATHLGVSRSAVEARLHRARSRLRSVLARTDVTAGDVVGART